jgi:FkbM family methyltransferase
MNKKSPFRLLFDAWVPNWAVALICTATIALLVWSNGYLMPAMKHCFKMTLRDFWFTTKVIDFTYRGHSLDLIDRRILAHGAYEKPILFFMRDYSNRACLGEATFVDVGANTGQHSLFMASKMAAVIAFEPFPPVLERFKQNVLLNQFDNITLHEVGLGNADSRSEFFMGEVGNQMTGTFAKELTGESKSVGSFRIVAGDSLITPETGQRVKLLKIDIEGFERYALEGLQNTLRAGRPVVIQELTSKAEASFRSKSELTSIYPPDYTFFYLNDDDVEGGRYALRPFDFRFDAEARYTLVAAPTDVAEILAGLSTDPLRLKRDHCTSSSS